MKAVIRLEHIGDDVRAYQKHGKRRNDLYEHKLLRGEGAERLRPWVAQLQSYNQRTGDFDRKFLHGVKDYSRANSVGSRGVFEYIVLNTGYYEVNERVSWKKTDRYFIRVIDEDITRITLAEVLACLTNDVAI